MIFGPINSRRFGKSLGIDLSPHRKQCNFDCLYCELGSAKTINRYEDITPMEKILSSLISALKLYKDIDVITITANGEPTLYPHLLELIDRIDKIKGSAKTLILSNGSTVDNIRIQNSLMKFDIVKLSLDCGTDRCLKKLDRSHKDISLDKLKSGMLGFRKKFNNWFIIEILFVKNINDKKDEIRHLNDFLLELKPTRIDIGTVDRPPAYDIKALNYQDLRDIAFQFDDSLPIYITSRKRLTKQPTTYSRKNILETIKKRPFSKEDIEVLFDEQTKKEFLKLVEEREIIPTKSGGIDFFVLKGKKN